MSSMRAEAAIGWHWPHLLLLAALVPAGWLATRQGWAPTGVLAAWLLLNFGVLAVGEWLRPYRRDWRATPRHWRRDGSVLAANLLTDAGIGAALLALAITLRPGSAGWPIALQVLVGALAAEFGSYWLHRWSHRGGWLWRVHLLHHRPDRLNLANAVTAHPINAGYDKAVRLLPLLLLGLAPEAVLLVGMFGLTQALATHANVAGRIGPLDWLLGSAELHRLHHSDREAEAGNFGTALPLWDQLFGTWRRGPAPERVGVFDPARYPGEFALRRLLWWPVCPPCAR